MPRRKARATQADIARAIRALLQAECCGALEVLPDGTIRVIPWSSMLMERPVVKKRDAVL